MTNTHAELLKLQTGAENEPNKENLSSELLERERIDNTPFVIVGNKEKGYFLAFGKYKVLENKPTKAEIRNDLEKRKWYVMMDTVICILDLIEHQKLYMVKTDGEPPTINTETKKG